MAAVLSSRYTLDVDGIEKRAIVGCVIASHESRPAIIDAVGRSPDHVEVATVYVRAALAKIGVSNPVEADVTEITNRVLLALGFQE